MEFDTLEGRHGLTLLHDSSGNLDLKAPHALWAGNIAASSQLWQVEFVAAKTRLSVLDTSSRGVGNVIAQFDLVDSPAVHRLDPWWNASPRGFTHLRVLELFHREVLVGLSDEGLVTIWRTIDLYKGSITPWLQFSTQDSAWGVDIYGEMLAVSDNSQCISLYRLGLDNNTPIILETKRSEPLGGNIPSVAFVGGGFISYTLVHLDMESGSFGVLDTNLESVYSVKTQQPGWCVKPLCKSELLRVASPFDLCGSELSEAVQGLCECVDVCNVSFHLDTDRLGFYERWTQPQTWMLDQQKRHKEWVKHGRRKPFMSVVAGEGESSASIPVQTLSDYVLFVTMSVHASLAEASTGFGLATAHRAFLPPVVSPSEYTSVALSICEVIPELALAIVVSRAAMITIVRFTRLGDTWAFRQEQVLCDFTDFIVGLSVRPARAHDFEYELRELSEPRDYDVPDKSVGLCGKWLVRLHGLGGQAESFLLS